MRLAIVAAALAALSVPAAAAPSPGVQEFTLAAQKLILVENQAILATQCGLRSDAWLTMMSDGIETVLIEEGNATGVHAAQAASIHMQISRLVQTYQPRPTPTVCANLRNSAIMDKLDAMEHAITGGYH